MSMNGQNTKMKLCASVSSVDADWQQQRYLKGVSVEDTSSRGDEVSHQHGEARQTQEEEAWWAPPNHRVQHIRSNQNMREEGQKK